MPVADLLNPIPGEKSGGENLRYSGLYDKVKEARREDDDAPTGAWEYQRKRADWPLVIKLCTEGLTKKSKDLWLGAWLTEAWIRTKGIAGLCEGLELLLGMMENFWDGLFPELEDGDAELRATPLEWIGSQLDRTLKNVKLTGNGLNWIQYRESKSIGFEADAASDDTKLAARNEAIAEGKITGEMFEAAVNSTPKSFYVGFLEQLDAAVELIEKLNTLGNEKFGDVAPSYSPLLQSMEEVRGTARTLLAKKRETEPDEESAGTEESGAEAPAEEESGYAVSSGGAAAAPARKKVAALSAEPVDADDAQQRIYSAVRFLRTENPSSPTPYMILRALRWGQLREGDPTDSSQLEAPLSEIRKRVRAAAGEGNWDEVLTTIEGALETRAGGAWLDAQRYAVRACDEMGYSNVAAALRAELKALLADFPALKHTTFNDDTPTAGPETLEWLKEFEPAPQSGGDGEASAGEAEEVSVAEEATSSGEQAPDAYELAKRAASDGRKEEAIEILSREAAQQRCGRERFRRTVQLAQICMAAKCYGLAYPILQGLAEEIQARRLFEWESPELIGQALSLLYRCMDKNGADDAQKAAVYAQLCRIDPALALQFSR